MPYIIVVFLMFNIVGAEDKFIPILDMKTKTFMGSSKGDVYYDPHKHFYDYRDAHRFINKDFNFYTIAGLQKGQIHLKALIKADKICPDYFGIITDSSYEKGIALASDLSWNPMPRTIKSLMTNSKIYNEVVMDILIKEGIPKPIVSIKQLYRSDLDGDGKEEVIIVADHHRYPIALKTPVSDVGNYSFVMVRTLHKGVIKNILIEGSFYLPKYEKKESRFIPNRYELLSILDANGDGGMEIVVHSSYYEGAFTTVYTLKDGEIHKVLETGCGL